MTESLNEGKEGLPVADSSRRMGHKLYDLLLLGHAALRHVAYLKECRQWYLKFLG
jgi:hypothetical protein